jgi:SagB-type dehydrogenase family enzyme
MPYPSGGGLYSVQAFLCCTSKNISNWPSQSMIWHLLPFQRCFESMEIDKNANDILNILSGNDTTRLGNPHFAIVYATFIDKAIFKYRHRGYRLAILEAGAMFQCTTLRALDMGYSSRVWAGFSDHAVARLLKVDLTHILPLAVQFFGVVR